MAGRADLNVDLRLGRAGHELVTARAAHVGIYIFGVNSCLHSPEESSGGPCLPATFPADWNGRRAHRPATGRSPVRESLALLGSRATRTDGRQRVVHPVQVIDLVVRVDGHGRRARIAANRAEERSRQLRVRRQSGNRHRARVQRAAWAEQDLERTRRTRAGVADDRHIAIDLRPAGHGQNRDRLDEQIRPELRLSADHALARGGAEHVPMGAEPPE